ncbi:ROK family transcriptional regulator [Actinokineospora guangxiensis]|uniref:ROK family transcriptional regulator n=1 Tax=Actinokineospora guangxiensis TaxID=1490288 RepID=A0ABW0EUD7_9PSEU
MSGSARVLRGINDVAVLRHLLARGPVSRVVLGELTGLTKPTVSQVVKRLAADGLVRSSGHTTGKPGPNAELYAVDAEAGFAAAVSVRAGSLVASVCDVAGVVRGTAEVTGLGDPAADVAEAVKAAARRGRVAVARLGAVQVAVPGAYDPAADAVRLVDVAGWDQPGVGLAIGRRLRAPVAVDNDVNLAAVAERSRGAAAGLGSFALLWLGEDGLGLAVDLAGRLVRGARGGAGEIGYLPVSAGGDFHALVSGAAVRDLAKEHGLSARTGAGAVAKAFATDGHDGFRQALARRVARGVAAVVAVMEPPVVVLAGEVGRAGGEPLCWEVRAALAELSVLVADIVPSAVDGDTVLTGAVEAARERVWAAILDSR